MREVDERRLHPVVSGTAGIRSAQNERKTRRRRKPFQFGGNSAAGAERAVDRFAEMRQLVDQQRMHFHALIFHDVPLVLAVAEKNCGAVAEPDDGRRTGDPAAAGFQKRGKQDAKPVRTVHVVPQQFRIMPAEQKICVFG